MLLFLQWEEQAFFKRWDFMLGLVWTEEDLEALATSMAAAENTDGSLAELEARADSEKKGGAMRFPLSLLVRPELIETLKSRILPSQGKLGMSHVPSDALSLSDVHKEEFLRKMGVTPTSDFSLSNADPYGPSRRPQGGFKEGPLRRIDGKRN